MQSEREDAAWWSIPGADWHIAAFPPVEQAGGNRLIKGTVIPID